MTEKEHTCEEAESVLGGDPSEAYRITRDAEMCYLTIQTYADEEMVSDGEAEYVGEEVSSVTISIKYCPFCGTNLCQ